MMMRRSGSATHVARRPLIPRWVVVVVATGIVAVLYLAVVASRQAEPSLAFMPAAPAADAAGQLHAAQRAGVGLPLRPGAASVDRSRRGGGTFAAVDGLALALPHPAPELVAFHEASRPEALPLDPVGRLTVNENPTKFTPGEDTAGPDYVVLSSRGRSRPATSAVDIVVPEGAFAAAPVTGRVVEVRQYDLYGRVRDWRVVIEPEDRPDLHVVLIHLHQPGVAPGDRVEAGVTPLAAARLLPFSSHVDGHLGARRPHVHLEVKPALAAAPLDPNAPALLPEEAEAAAG
jgi:hypothetical protein